MARVGNAAEGGDELTLGPNTDLSVLDPFLLLSCLPWGPPSWSVLTHSSPGGISLWEEGRGRLGHRLVRRAFVISFGLEQI